MIWNNYELNEDTLTITDALKTFGLEILKKYYGKFEVEEDILDEVESELMLQFAPMAQALSIFTGLNNDSSKQMDVQTENNTIRDDASTSSNQDGNSTNNRTTSTTTDSTVNNDNTGSVTNTGTTGTVETSEQDSTGNVSSSTPMTGSKIVNVGHAMPEQSINGTTEDFTRDSQGTPELDSSTVQNAQESYTTTNSFSNNQDTTGNVTITNNNTVTDNTTTATTDNTDITNHGEDSGTDDTTATNHLEVTGENHNVHTEEYNRELANKQYAFEVTKILESLQGSNPVQTFVYSFAWVCGVQ